MALRAARPSEDLRDPVRDPRAASPRERTRRAAILLSLTALVPGGAQSVAGDRRLGRAGLRVWLGVWAAVVLAAVLALVARTPLLTLLTQDLVLRGLTALLVVGALGWAVLWVDTFRLIRAHLLAPGARWLTAAATVLGLVATSGGLGWAAWATDTVRSTLGTVFADGPALEEADGRYNILLMGGDAGEGRTGLRPDSMHVASIDARSGSVVLLSLPRNLQNAVFAEGSPLWQAYPDGFSCGDRCILNALYDDVLERHPDLYPEAADPGAEAMMDAAGGILGLDVDGYALMDMAGFARLIDAIGGVDIVSGGYVTHRGTRPDGKWGNVWWAPGEHHFDGDDALAFARSRHWASDYSRIRRQQCLQAAMLDRFTPATVLTRLGPITRAGGEIVSTNLPQRQAGTFAALASKARGSEMTRLTIGGDDFGPAERHFTTYPDYDEVHRRVAELIAQDEAGAQAAGARRGGGSPVPVLTLLATGGTGSGVKANDPKTWPAPPTREDGQPFTAQDLMEAEDAGREDVLAHASSTNALCTTG